jgi:dienelactone hydrolase
MLRHIIIILLLTSVCTFSISAKSLSTQLPYIFYVTVPVEIDGEIINISAQYRLPREEVINVPAVLILHSSSGVDSTGGFYAKALNKAGIATLELDLWGGRGLLGGSEGRPALPTATLADVYAALDFLANRTEIDVSKIGVLGFSWGGVLSMLTATEAKMSVSGTENRFAGHVAHYPVCWTYNSGIPGLDFGNLTGAPILIQAAEFDDYDAPDTCENLINSLDPADADLVSLKVYNGAYHAWDRLEPEWIVNDPFSHLGQGGLVTLSPNKRIARKSKRKVVKFFINLFHD